MKTLSGSQVMKLIKKHKPLTARFKKAGKVEIRGAGDNAWEFLLTEEKAGRETRGTVTGRTVKVIKATKAPRLTRAQREELRAYANYYLQRGVMGCWWELAQAIRTALAEIDLARSKEDS